MRGIRRGIDLVIMEDVVCVEIRAHPTTNSFVYGVYVGVRKGVMGGLVSTHVSVEEV